SRCRAASRSIRSLRLRAGNETPRPPGPARTRSSKRSPGAAATFPPRRTRSSSSSRPRTRRRRMRSRCGRRTPTEASWTGPALSPRTRRRRRSRRSPRSGAAGARRSGSSRWRLQCLRWWWRSRVSAASGGRAGSLLLSAWGPRTLSAPLPRLARGWWLVYWRVISVDGHPVRGAFTFAVGPNPGPAPQFPVPSISETAATPSLVTARAIVFLSVMAAIGLFILRIATARPVVRRVSETRLRALSVAFGISAAIALIATPVYVVMATAQFALRGVFDLGNILPLVRDSAFGRGYLDLELTFALFVLAAALALWVDRPERPQRSIAELLSTVGALLAAAATLLVPGLSGHAAQTAPRGLSVVLDWLHLAAGSVWVGGLIGLLVLWRSLPVARRVAALSVCVPRFSNTAFVSVLLLIGSGVGASIIHFPTFSSLWQTSYGQALLVKIGLLGAASMLAAVNLLRTKPRLAAYPDRPELGTGAALLLRRLVSGETLLISAAVVAAAVLSSLPP